MDELPFRPAAVCGGRLTAEEVKARQEICTRKQLALLMKSQEYRIMKRRNAAPGRRDLLLAIASTVVLVGVCLGFPFDCVPLVQKYVPGLAPAMTGNEAVADTVQQHASEAVVAPPQATSPWGGKQQVSRAAGAASAAAHSAQLVQEWWDTYVEWGGGKAQMRTGYPVTPLRPQDESLVLLLPPGPAPLRLIGTLAGLALLLGCALLLQRRREAALRCALRMLTGRVEAVVRSTVRANGSWGGSADGSNSASPRLSGLSAGGVVDELEAALALREEEVMALREDISKLTVVHQLELRSKEDSLYEVRCWLDQAQGQLQNTQTALSDKEADARKWRAAAGRAREQLAAAQEDAKREAQHVAQQLREAEGGLQELGSKLEAVQAELQAQQQARESAEAGAEQLRKQLEGTRTEAKAAADKVAGLDRQLLAAKVDLRTAQAKLQSSDETSSVRALEVMALRSRAEQAEGARDDLQGERDGLEQQLASLRAQLEEQRSGEPVRRQADEQHAAHVQAAESRASELEQQIATLRAELEERRAAEAAQKRAEEERAARALSVEARAGELGRRAEELEEQVATLSAELEDRHQAARRAGGEAQLLQGRLEEAEQQLADANHRLEQEAEALGQQRAQAQAAAQAAEQRHLALQDTVGCLDSQLTGLHSQLGECRREAEGLRGELAAAQAERDGALKAMSEHEVAALREQLEAAEATLTGRKMSSMAAELQAARQAAKRWEAEYSSLQGDMDSAFAARRELQEQLRYAQEQQQRVSEELEEVQKKLEAREQQREAGGGGSSSPDAEAGLLQKQVEAQRERLQAQQDSLDNMCRQLAASEAERASVEAALDAMRESHAQLAEQACGLEREVADLRSALRQAQQQDQDQQQACGVKGQDDDGGLRASQESDRSSQTQHGHEEAEAERCYQEDGENVAPPNTTAGTQRSPLLLAKESGGSVLADANTSGGGGGVGGSNCPGPCTRPPLQPQGSPTQGQRLVCGLRRKAESLSRSNSCLKAQLLLLTYRHWGLQGKMDAMQSQGAALVESTDVSTKELAQLQHQGTGEGGAGPTPQQLAATTQRLERGLQTLLTDNDNLRAQLCRARAAQEQLQGELAAGSASLGELAADVDALAHALRCKEEECAELAARLDEVARENGSLRAGLEQLEEEQAEKEAEADRANQQVEVLTAKVSSMMRSMVSSRSDLRSRLEEAATTMVDAGQRQQQQAGEDAAVNAGAGPGLMALREGSGESSEVEEVQSCCGELDPNAACLGWEEDEEERAGREEARDAVATACSTGSSGGGGGGENDPRLANSVAQPPGARSVRRRHPLAPCKGAGAAAAAAASDCCPTPGPVPHTPGEVSSHPLGDLGGSSDASTALTSQHGSLLSTPTPSATGGERGSQQQQQYRHHKQHPGARRASLASSASQSQGSSPYWFARG